MLQKIKTRLLNSFIYNKNELISAEIEKYKAQQKEIKLRELDKLYNTVLEPKYFQNSRIVSSRFEMLDLFPKNAICSEIGVDHGDFSEKILSLTQPKKLHLIDKWGDEARYHDGLKLLVNEKFSEQIKTEQVEINLGYSVDVLVTFPDNYFDWAYLDTVHDYEYTKKELAVLKDKVKTDGIIAGHDFVLGNWFAGWKYGVIEAVLEFCEEYNYEFLYISMDFPNSFALKKKLY